VEDHHVDRLDVEVQQCMKLTSTNRSIGLIAFIISAHRFDQIFVALRWPGDYGGAPTPDPIPNSAVKGSSADGTKS
jgi:hypothetical protein